MQDAEAAKPVCDDRYARMFMNEDGLRIYEAFKDEVKPNAANVARHRIIDDFLRRELGADHNLQIVLIGAGFDSRAFRLNGGKWIELDEPQIISYKNERLPLADCKNELQRIPIDFSTGSLEQKLLPFSSRTPTVVVIEGVFMYLEEDVIRHLLHTLRRLFPKHKLICDLMSRSFFEKYSRTLHEKIVGLGTSFITRDDPEEVFINNGYYFAEKISIVGRAIDFGSIRVPKILFRVFLRTLSKGYSIYVFALG
jgi:methyltransferase (TIGR00027 family)